MIKNDHQRYESISERDSLPYTPYTSQPQQEIETLHSLPTVQDEAPYTSEIPLKEWLSPESLKAIRESWELADSEELRAEVRKAVPIEVLMRAIAH